MRLPAALFALALLVGSACSRTRAESLDDAPIQWTIHGTPADGRVQLEISRHAGSSTWMMGRTVDLAALQGLTAVELASDNAMVRFRMPRDAGTLECQGVVRRGHGTGECAFAASESFAEALAARGIGRPTPSQQFSMALNDIGLAYIAALDRLGYDRPRAADLADAGNHGVTLDYLTGMAGHGYRVGSLAALIGMRDHGVTPDYIAALARQDVRDISADDIVRLRDHGVSADFVAALRAAGYDRFGTDDIIRLRDHGVTASYIGELRALGYAGLGADEIAGLRDHGVMPDFIRDANRGGARHTPAELIRLRNAG